VGLVDGKKIVRLHSPISVVNDCTVPVLISTSSDVDEKAIVLAVGKTYHIPCHIVSNSTIRIRPANAISTPTGSVDTSSAGEADSGWSWSKSVDLEQLFSAKIMELRCEKVKSNSAARIRHWHCFHLTSATVPLNNAARGHCKTLRF
jgi:hypothetical protein